MAIETGRTPAVQITPRQRWSIAFSYMLVIIGLLLGVNQRDSLLNQTSLYSDNTAGISASYPARWLLDESQDNVFRIRDMSHLGFKTTIEVRSLPVGADGAERNLLDHLSLQRSQVFIDYSVLGYDTFRFPDDSQAVSMAYTFVSRHASPFLEGVSAVVNGLDILTIRRGQALVVSFRAESSQYERELQTFYRFIENLEF